MGHHENESFIDRVKDALGFGGGDHEHDHDHDHDHEAVSTGVAEEPPGSVPVAGDPTGRTVIDERHAADPLAGGDAPIHGDPAASSFEANENRPAGPDYGAEDTATGAFDPDAPRSVPDDDLPRSGSDDLR